MLCHLNLQIEMKAGCDPKRSARPFRAKKSAKELLSLLF
jgi:hypothetical protein